MARNRSLSQISEKLSKSSTFLEETLTGLLAKKKKLKVLEVGFGHGRALLEFAWKFRDSDVRFFGVDKKCKPPVERSQDLLKIARSYDIFDPEGVEHFEFPELHFYDATRLNFDDEQFDLIYSAVTIRFIPGKAKFLEEVCRVLEPGGLALLHLSESGWNYPYSRVESAPVFSSPTALFILKYGNMLIPLDAYFKLFNGDSFKFKLRKKGRCVLQVEKFRSGKVSLNLTIDAALSGPLHKCYRSVYNVSEAHYRALMERGLIGQTDSQASVGSQLISQQPGPEQEIKKQQVHS